MPAAQKSPDPFGADAPNPAVAALATWFVPGAGHLYMGQQRAALVGFVTVQLLYVLGVLLSGGLFLSILPNEMRGTFSAVLTPEAGNLGALLVHVKMYGFGGTQPQVWPGTLHLGVALTAAAGILNLLLASRAHFDAREMRAPTIEGAAPHPALAAALTWVFPGAGHVLQGRVARGATVAVLLVGLFALGSVLADGVNLDRTRHFYYWGGQAFLGPVALLIEQLVGHARMESVPTYGEAGVVIASIAGMLNVLVMLDVYGFSDAKLYGRPLPTEKGRTAPSNESTEVQAG